MPKRMNFPGRKKARRIVALNRLREHLTMEWRQSKDGWRIKREIQVLESRIAQKGA